MCEVNAGLQIPLNQKDEEFNRNLNTGYLNLMNISNIKNYQYYKSLNNKLELEVGNFLREKTNNPKLYSNDIRHQYVSALYARNFGEDKAKWLGNFNERASIGTGSGMYDTKIDKINNEIGIMYAKKYPNVSRRQLLEILWQDYPQTRKYSRTILGN